ncbi:MAG: M67 family metallopeptidase [Flavitalea sp.]
MIFVESKAGTIMNEDTLKTYNNECCGFLFGRENTEGDRIISDAIVVINSSGENKTRRFVISPKDYLKAEQYALTNGLDLIGVYHSHPDHPAVPSEHDRVAAQPWFSYIIISVDKNGIRDTRSWRLNEESIFEEEFFSEQLLNNNKS